VFTPENAFRCFMGTEIEVLFAGNCILQKKRQGPARKLDYKDDFELDSVSKVKQAATRLWPDRFPAG
jgi:hypothetical protein